MNYKNLIEWQTNREQEFLKNPIITLFDLIEALIDYGFFLYLVMCFGLSMFLFELILFPKISTQTQDVIGILSILTALFIIKELFKRLFK